MCSLYMFSFVDKYYTQERARVSMSVGYSSVAVNLRVLCISSKTTKDICIKCARGKTGLLSSFFPESNITKILSCDEVIKKHEAQNM